MNGADLTSTDQLADATTPAVAASGSATAVVRFAVNPALAIRVSPATLDLGAVSPEASASGTHTVNVKSNDTWSLRMKSVGRNGGDESPGEDAVFASGSGKTIPVGRMSWNVGTGTPAAVSDSDAALLAGQLPTPHAGVDALVNLTLAVQYSDPVATDYQTVLLYTVTQP